MKRLVVAVVCCRSAGKCRRRRGRSTSDQAMANRYLQAAQSGSDDAQFYLAALYSAGVGVPRSDEEAVRWFSRAAEQGHSHAMLILAGLYAVGRGVPKDNIKAYKWAYIVGAGSRVEEFRNGARQLTSLLESRMTPDDVNWRRAMRAAGARRPARAGTNGGACAGSVRAAATAPAPAVSRYAAPAAPQPPHRSRLRRKRRRRAIPTI